MVEPQSWSYEAFPESNLTAEGMHIIRANRQQLYGNVDMNIEYAQKDGIPLHVQIISPFHSKNYIGPSLPLIAYVQGSAFHKQRLGAEIPQLSRFSFRGYVIAIIEYRPSEVAPFPAQIKDAKTAIRFLIDHAAQFHIDPGRVYMWGDSSGAHTTVMTNLTRSDSAYTDEADLEPLDIKAFVDYYGPTDISRMNEYPSIQNHCEPDSPEGWLIGRKDVLQSPELTYKVNPANHVTQDSRPLLIIHGSKDRTVNFHQSVLLYEKLKEARRPVEFYKLIGADHQDPAFWTEEIFDLVDAFLKRHTNS